MKKISVVIPMYYEEKVAQECYNRTKSVLENLKKYDYFVQSSIVFSNFSFVLVSNLIIAS